MTRLEELIDKVTKRNAHLDTVSDELTAQIEHIERKLETAGVRLSAWHDEYVLTEREGSWQIGYGVVFGFDGERDRFGFLARRGPTDKTTALVRAPRRVRVAAAPLLADVIASIDERIQSIHADIESATDTVRELAREGEGNERDRQDSARPRRRVRSGS